MTDGLNPSNGFGLFQMGISPLGTLPSFDWRATVISQYANSPIMLSIIDSFFDTVDQTQNLDDFFDLIWNVDTAVGYGLDVWGRIVGVSRTLEVATGDFFGFDETGQPDITGFNQAPFFTGDPFTQNFTLSDADYRTLILAKAFSNLSDCSIPSINELLRRLFPSAGGNAYVVDNEDMTITFTFRFILTAVQLAIVENSGVLPKPVGVSANINIV